MLSVPAISLLLSLAAETAAAQLPPPQPGAPGFRALGGLVAGPYSAQNGLYDRCVGVEYAWGHYWVSAASTGIAGKVIHKYTTTGTYRASYPQVTASPEWGFRDLEADEAANTLWAGADFGEFSTYRYDPLSGGLTYLSKATIPALGTVYALARNPSTGNFYTCSFSGPVYEFKPTGASGTIVRSWPNPGSVVTGFAWDPVNLTLWASGEDYKPGTCANYLHVFQLDLATMTKTGVEYWGQNVSGSCTPNESGGLDMYEDPRNPGKLSHVLVHQLHTSGPDSVGVYDSEVAVAAPSFHLSVNNLFAGETTTAAVENATPGGPVVLGYSLAGGGPLTVPAGSCGLLTVGMSLPITSFNLTADAAGTASLSANVPPGTSGVPVWLEAVDLASCAQSGALALRIGEKTGYVVGEGAQTNLFTATTAGDVAVDNDVGDTVEVLVNGVVKATIEAGTGKRVGYQAGDTVAVRNPAGGGGIGSQGTWHVLAAGATGGTRYFVKEGTQDDYITDPSKDGDVVVENDGGDTIEVLVNGTSKATISAGTGKKVGYKKGDTVTIKNPTGGGGGGSQGTFH